ncbi:hypothetical protein Zmor_009797 [Zophobas morio]|uniref:Protein croquemort n=1 Tax=Zophobas morio TaxID=2755281 RepID=A0AA38IQ87_9CUCU|nr:hypothetical protein Zmor_009797 [Zophobas morio]
MRIFTPKCGKWTLLGFAIFFVLISIVLIFFTDDIVDAVKDQQFNLGSDDTMVYGFWEVTPIPLYMNIYLFNWTNPQEVIDSKWTIKPSFTQMGPYSFHEKHYRKHVKFNDNHTLTYQTQRIWNFAPERSAGSLDDLVTTINPVLVTISNIVKYKHPIAKLAANGLFKERAVTHTVTKTAQEFIFDGYDDAMFRILKKLRLRHIKIPYGLKFGWFADRNGSLTYDGTFNMYDGSDDIRKLGRITSWNYDSQDHFPSYCGRVNGTSGELFYPVLDDQSVQIFSNDLCSTISLDWEGTQEILDIEGHKFVIKEKEFDNGTKYPEMACFSPGDVLPNGLRNVTDCYFGAPAFLSGPHFYLSDPVYRDAIDGMQPDADEHGITVVIEPETGIPLHAKVAMQINLRVENIERINLLENAKEYFIPVVWFKEEAEMSDDLGYLISLLLRAPTIGQDTGFGVLALGCILFGIFGFIVYNKIW